MVSRTTGEGPIGVTAAIACGMYEIYHIWSLSMELSELTQEVLVLEGMLHRTKEARVRILGYATDAGLTLVCLGLARLPF